MHFGEHRGLLERNFVVRYTSASIEAGVRVMKTHTPDDSITLILIPRHPAPLPTLLAVHPLNHQNLSYAGENLHVFVARQVLMIVSNRTGW
jgi:hypothetical protein